MATRKLNVALIGSGFMGKAHSLAYAAMPMFFWPPAAIPVRKIVADVSEHLAREAAERFGYERWTGDWRSVLQDDSIDIVDIATPNHLHADIAIAAAEAGKHIISEKPLARSAAEARPMLEAVARAGVVHAVAFNYRRTPAVAYAKQLIDEGAIGQVINFRGTYLQTGPQIQTRRCRGGFRNQSSAPAHSAISPAMYSTSPACWSARSPRCNPLFRRTSRTVRGNRASSICLVPPLNVLMRRARRSMSTTRS